MALLRRLWSEPYVTFKGRFHDLENVGLARPAAVPIWFGTGTDEVVLRRVARLADGWMTIGDFLPHISRFQQYLREAGRDPAGFIMTSIIGIAGSFAATYGGQAMGLYKMGEQAGFIGSLFGAIALLAVYHLIRQSPA